MRAVIESDFRIRTMLTIGVCTAPDITVAADRARPRPA